MPNIDFSFGEYYKISFKDSNPNEDYLGAVNQALERMSLYNQFPPIESSKVRRVTDYNILESGFVRIYQKMQRTPSSRESDEAMQYFTSNVIQSMPAKEVSTDFISGILDYGRNECKSWCFEHDILKNVRVWTSSVEMGGRTLAFDRNCSIWRLTTVSDWSDPELLYSLKSFSNYYNFLENILIRCPGTPKERFNFFKMIRSIGIGCDYYVTDSVFMSMVETKEDLFELQSFIQMKLSYFMINISLLRTACERGIAYSIDDFKRIGFTTDDLNWFMTSYVENMERDKETYSKVYSFTLKDLLQYQMEVA